VNRNPAGRGSMIELVTLNQEILILLFHDFPILGHGRVGPYRREKGPSQMINLSVRQSRISGYQANWRSLFGGETSDAPFSSPGVSFSPCSGSTQLVALV
jgi:hypothetical protein